MDDRRLQPGDRVHLAGTVAYERSGFVTVTWDNGTQSTVWRADLASTSAAPPRFQASKEDHDG